MELVYWAGAFPGRAEFIRLLFVYRGESFVDTRDSQRVVHYRQLSPQNPAGFAPPYLVVDGRVYSQTAAIAAHVAERMGWGTQHDRYHLLQSAMTVMDVAAEIHNLHHPISTSLYYEDSKEEALRAAQIFWKARASQILSFFEKQIANAGGAYLFGREANYPDIMLYHLMDGIQYSFPQNSGRLFPQFPHLLALYEAIKSHAHIAAYLKSDKRLPYGNGVFRYYAELDEME